MIMADSAASKAKLEEDRKRANALLESNRNDDAAGKISPAKKPQSSQQIPPPQETARPHPGESGFAKMFEKFGALASGFFSKITSALPKPKPKLGGQYVPETPFQIAEKKGEAGGEFETEVDAFLRLVKERKKISLKAAASALGESEVVVEEWATILDRSGLVRLVYPGNPMESPYVVLKEPGTSNNTATGRT